MTGSVPTVLVIDDNVALAQGFARGLTLAGFAVHTAHRAEVALQLAIEHRPDAIILDFKMPFINGAGFLYRLRDLHALQQTPVLVITGESLDEEARHAIQTLDAQVREKPISLTDLIQETRFLIERHCHNELAKSRVVVGPLN